MNNSIVFDTTEKILIEAKLNNPSFSYKDWSDDSLSAIRSKVRSFYRKVQNGKCSYCKNILSIISASNCHVEHIAPKSRYRDFIFEPKNLCVICADCNEIKRQQETIAEIIDTLYNGEKRKIYPRSSNAFKIVHPHFDIYEDHILKLASGYYLDKSKKGHFTIGSCKLNRRLYEFGWEKEAIDSDLLSDAMREYLDETSNTKRMMLLKKIQLLVLEID